MVKAELYHIVLDKLNKTKSRIKIIDKQRTLTGQQLDWSKSKKAQVLKDIKLNRAYERGKEEAFYQIKGLIELKSKRSRR